MIEYLQGFDKRMEFFAIVESIAKRKNKSEKIEELFEKNELDNLIMSVLVYIMEITLTEEKECTLENIVQFVRDILPNYKKKFSIQETEEITRYIVKDILQNKGSMRSYDVMNYEKGNQEIPIRLITDKINEDNKIVYELSKQGYDFLFRTKEVEDELGFQIEEIKLKMLIKKKNYQGAIKQSKELIRRLINRKIEFAQFENKLKSNMNDISDLEYENLVNNMNLLIQEEYEEMKQIDDLLTKSKERLAEEEKQHEKLDEKIKKAKVDVSVISKNVKTALRYQRQLLTQAQNLKKLYLQILEDAIYFTQKKRYNIEEQILEPLEKMKIKSTKQIYNIYHQLVNPLFLVSACKRLNLNLLYDSQSKIKEKEEDYQAQIEEYEDNIKRLEEIKRKNEIHISIIENLFDYAKEKQKTFLFSEWFYQLSDDKREKFIKDKRVFLVMLKLYEIQTISISEFLKEEIVNREGNGEFDLSYCLYQILKVKKQCYLFDGIKIEKMENVFQYEVRNKENIEKIEINDFRIEVNIFRKELENGGSTTNL